MAYKSTCKTLAKVAEDEPIFVLRAQDLTAPDTIMAWIAKNPELPKDKLAEALRCAQAMRQWPKRKMPD